MDDLKHFAANGHIYSKFDISSGFHHLSVDEQTIPLLGFTTPVGVYSWLKSPMGTKYDINTYISTAFNHQPINQNNKDKKIFFSQNLIKFFQNFLQINFSDVLPDISK